MRRQLVLGVLALVLCKCAVEAVGKVPNKLIVKFGVLPIGSSAFFDMPRTVAEAEKSSYAKVAGHWDADTTLLCRANDYRVCLLFDKQQSVAGIQISVSVADLTNSKAPVDVANIPEWRRQTVLGVDVYSATVFFVSKEVLERGGRPLTEDTHTAPEGVFILQNDKNGAEVSRLHVGTDPAGVVSAGFSKQACFQGMGDHYYQGMTKDSKCENHRPFFTLHNPNSKKLHGIGFNMYGKSSHGDRKWFEGAFSLVDRIIVPNAPKCRYSWIDKYGMFTLHMYFVENPWFTQCFF